MHDAQKSSTFIKINVLASRSIGQGALADRAQACFSQHAHSHMCAVLSALQACILRAACMFTPFQRMVIRAAWAAWAAWAPDGSYCSYLVALSLLLCRSCASCLAHCRTRLIKELQKSAKTRVLALSFCPHIRACLTKTPLIIRCN